MHAFEVLSDPVRRQILELLAQRSLASGEVVKAVQTKHRITQAAVSQHLKVLREHGFAQVEVDGARRIYSLRSEPLQEVDDWLSTFRRFWTEKLDALADEIERGKREGP